MLWQPIAALLNFFSWRREPVILQDVECVVVCKFKGLGSIVQATPLLAAIRNRHPNAKLVFVSTEGNRQLLSMIPHLDALLCVEEGSWRRLLTSLRKVRRQVRSLKPDVFINLEIHSHFSGVFTWRSGAPTRLGFLGGGQPLRSGLYSQQLPFDPDAPLSGMYFSFSRLLGCKEQEGALYNFSQQVASNANLKRPQGGGLWVLNPNASDGRLERRWPAESFAALARKLLADGPGGQVLFTGAASERDYVEGIVGKVGDPRARNTAGEFNLGELMSLLASADVFVTNDTGPMHLAFAMGIPTVALFGPVAPWKYRVPAHVTAVYERVACSPCLHSNLLPPCGGNNICMRAIGVDQVLDAIRQMEGKA